MHTTLLGARITALNPLAVNLSKSLQASMMAHGSDPVTASRQAYVATWGIVQRQASMLAFVDTFLAMAAVFLLVLPLLFVMKRPKHSRGGGAAAH